MKFFSVLVAGDARFPWAENIWLSSREVGMPQNSEASAITYISMALKIMKIP